MLWTPNVLIATGVADVLPSLPGLEAVQQRGLLRHCPICDGHEHCGRRIAVLGDGVHALREARFLAHYSTQVSLVGLQDVPPSDAQGAVATLSAPAQALSLSPEGGVQITLHDGRRHHADLLYAALGVLPRAELALSVGAQADEHGNLRVDAHGATGIPGLYAAGDVVSALDQLAVAVGHGAIAATAIHHRLPERAAQALHICAH
jgi:thioredoxin reductase (NADPH)